MIETDKKPSILIVDDSLENINTLALVLKKEYQVIVATNGYDAIEKANGNGIDIILLDIIMPEMDGFEVCEKLKANEATRHIPVVFITGETNTESIVRGLKAGAYYYLTKPANIQIVRIIIKAALSEQAFKISLQDEVRKSTDALASYLEAGCFMIRTIEDASFLSAILAKTCPDPQKTVPGLMELLNNAVEHGNLGITYEEKSNLLKCGEWEIEIQKRLELPENKSKRVTVRFERKGHEIRFLITDEGMGFDWKPYLIFDPKRLFDPNGRGIAMAKNLSFDLIDYHGVGNEVLAVVYKQ